MIMALFGSHRQALERLTEVMAELTSVTTESYKRGTDQQTGYATAPTVATRYTDIQLPARVQVGRRFAVIVGLTMAPSPDSADAQPVKAVAEQPVRVVLTPAGALQVLGERVEELRVEAEREQRSGGLLPASERGRCARLEPRVLGGRPDRRHQPAQHRSRRRGRDRYLLLDRPASRSRQAKRPQRIPTWSCASLPKATACTTTCTSTTCASCPCRASACAPTPRPSATS